MAEKISVYVSEEMHRLFKAAASLQGKTLSEFMVDAASRALHNPGRKAASAKMDQVRESNRDKYIGSGNQADAG